MVDTIKVEKGLEYKRIVPYNWEFGLNVFAINKVYCSYFFLWENLSHYVFENFSSRLLSTGCFQGTWGMKLQHNI